MILDMQEKESKSRRDDIALKTHNTPSGLKLKMIYIL